MSKRLDKATALQAAVDSVRGAGPSPLVYVLEASQLTRVPGTPLAYWASKALLSTFDALDPFQTEARKAVITNPAGDDFRFFRTSWEAAPNRIGRSKGWVPLLKGGAYSTFYSDVHLVVAWDSERETYPGFEGTIHRPLSRPASVQWFFKPGLTYSRRSQRGFSCRVLPSESVFHDKGPGLFPPIPETPSILGLLNSSTFKRLLELQMAFGSYEVGVIQRTPVPALNNDDGARLGELALLCVEMKRELDYANETSRVFNVPAALSSGVRPLNDSLAAWLERQKQVRIAIEQSQAEIDAVAQSLYDIEEDDIASVPIVPSAEEDNAEQVFEEDDSEREDAASDNPRDFAAGLVSWLVGCDFGRFDVRIALHSSLAPALQGPFEPLPLCSPGTLVGPNGLPATKDHIASEDWLRARPNAITSPPAGSVAEPVITADAYPLGVEWDGIMVDDPDHPDDIMRRVRDVLHFVWGERADAVEHEACGMLGVKELRDWFRNPRGFWDDHVKRYSKSRRKAPIYWLLQSEKRGFALWLYYHCMDADMLAKALVNYVEPKLRLEESRLQEMQQASQGSSSTGAAARSAERDIERQEVLIGELKDFRTALERASRLGLQPDLDDGVVLNIAPLHELVPWRVARQYWDELLAGKYDWSTIAAQLRTKGLVH